MPYQDKLYIGTYAAGVNAMVAVDSLGADIPTDTPPISEGAFTVDPVHYSQEIGLADGSIIDMGWLEAAWHINGLRASQYEAIMAYRIDRTTPLYVRTLDNDSATYKNFLVDAIFQSRPNRGDALAGEDGQVFDFEIRFIKMIEQ